MSISCIIPCYNEAARIANVLEPVSRCKFIDEIIVVDDGSRDGSAAIARNFDRVRVLDYGCNRGKAFAIDYGVARSRGDHLLFIDSDLVGLTPGSVERLVRPVLEGKADLSLSLRRNTPGFWRIIGLDYISGERLVPRKLIARLDLKSIKGFGLEVLMNREIIKSRMRLAVVKWPRVISPMKSAKERSFWKGLKGDLRMMREMERTVGVFGMIYEVVMMEFLVSR